MAASKSWVQEALLVLRKQMSELQLMTLMQQLQKIPGANRSVWETLERLGRAVDLPARKPPQICGAHPKETTWEWCTRPQGHTGKHRMMSQGEPMGR